MRFRAAGTRRATARVLLTLGVPLLCLGGSVLGPSIASSAAAAPQLSATPTSLDFGDVVMGSTATAQQVKVTNIGTAAVKLTGTYGSSGPFTTTGNCVGATVPKNGTCQLTITFAPIGPGSFSATLVNKFNGVGVDAGVHGNGTAKLRISPLSLDFGDVAVGDTSALQHVTLTNLTSAPIQLNASSTTLGPFAAWIARESQSVRATSCSMPYEFVPKVVGPATGSDAGTWNGEKFSVALKGNGVPHFQITPTGLDFGAVLLRSAAAQQVVTVTNVGSSTVTMNGTNNGASPFGYSNDCQGVQLAAGQSCHMYFNFTPAKAGSVATTTTGSWNGQGYSISLTGYGRTKAPPPNPFRITPTSLDFGSATVGTASQEQDVTVTNQTANPITLNGSFAIDGPFGGGTDCAGGTLSPGQSCTLVYVFAPTTVGTVTGSGTSTLNGQQFSIPLAGRGTRRFLITPITLEFGPTHINAGQQQTVDITNEGPPVTMQGTGGAGGVFGGTQNCQGTTLATGATCQWFYQFAPTVPGRVTATATGTYNGQGYSISLGGFGLADLAMTPTGLGFVPQAVGTKSPAQVVSVHNVSGHALTLHITNNAAPTNFLVTNSCGTSLAAAASCSYSVIFKPTSTGAKTGTLKATINGQPLQVALTGKGK